MVAVGTVVVISSAVKPATTPPSMSVATHAPATGHETASMPLRSTSTAPDHAGAPPVGFVEESVAPYSSPTTHIVVVEHDRASGSPSASISAGADHAVAPPVGFVEDSRFPVPSIVRQ